LYPGLRLPQRMMAAAHKTGARMPHKNPALRSLIPIRVG
jgi:hypothetical protein